jgi:phospholipid/cholesterol/gamma-HCH transport system substrate-binding protein
METKANYVAVGVFVLACSFALVLAVLWLAGAQYREEYTLYRTYFEGGVSGLGPGTLVRYNGIEVGRVQDVTFDPEDPRRVIATLQVDPNIRLRQDSTASLESQGLTGVSFVELSGGTPDAPFLVARPGEDIPVIPYKPSAIQRLTESTPQLLERLNNMADRGNDLLNEENRKAFAETLTNMRELTASLNARTADIDRVATDLDRTTDRFEQTMAVADKTLESADQAAAALGNLARSADEVVKRGAIAEMNQLVGDARSLVTSLTRLTNELERQPTQLLFGDRREGYTPQ